MNKTARHLAILTLLCVLLGVMLYFAPKPFADFAEKFSSDAVFTVYCRETTLSAISVGNGYLVECGDLNTTLKFCNEVDGISARFCGNSDDFLKAQQLFGLTDFSLTQLCGVTVVSGYSAKVRGGVCLDGKLVNVQIAFDGQTITVGSPLILDSY